MFEQVRLIDGDGSEHLAGVLPYLGEISLLIFGQKVYRKRDGVWTQATFEVADGALKTLVILANSNGKYVGETGIPDTEPEVIRWGDRYFVKLFPTEYVEGFPVAAFPYIANILGAREMYEDAFNRDPSLFETQKNNLAFFLGRVGVRGVDLRDPEQCNGLAISILNFLF